MGALTFRPSPGILGTPHQPHCAPRCDAWTLLSGSLCSLARPTPTRAAGHGTLPPVDSGKGLSQGKVRQGRGGICVALPAHPTHHLQALAGTHPAAHHHHAWETC